ncbi:MAG: winged helix-turn-helix transcriptional regulator [Rhodoferax sp.]|nr:helix-turn-helix transcriptional regulator [Rhodoferax sp.]
MPGRFAPGFTPDLDSTRDAIASSTLSHGLMVLGDRWTTAVLMGAFTGVRRFEDWQVQLGIPRSTLTDRLKKLVALGLLRQTAYQQRPQRFAYRLTQEGLKLYDHVLMIWVWEKRWGSRKGALPAKLTHRPCGHHFVPVLSCSACGEKAGMNDLQLSFKVNQTLLEAARNAPRSSRVAAYDGTDMGLGLRVDRWSLLIVNAVILGCHYFDQIAHVLGIASSVLSRRLSGMVEAGLLICQQDLNDARRNIYRLTPSSRDLFAYLVCFSTWAARDYLRQPSSIRPIHKDCGRPFVPQVICSACSDPVKPWDVSFDPPAKTPATA